MKKPQRDSLRADVESMFYDLLKDQVKVFTFSQLDCVDDHGRYQYGLLVQLDDGSAFRLPIKIEALPFGHGGHKYMGQPCANPHCGRILKDGSRYCSVCRQLIKAGLPLDQVPPKMAMSHQAQECVQCGKSPTIAKSLCWKCYQRQRRARMRADNK